MTLSNQYVMTLGSTLTGLVGKSKTSASISDQITNDLAGTDLLYTVTEEITGTENDLDLTSGLLDPLAGAIVFAKLMLIYIKNNGSAVMKIGAAAANPIALFDNPASDEMLIAPGAYFLYIDPTGITIGLDASDILRITGTATDEYELILVGAS